MEAVSHPIVLHVYELTPPASSDQNGAATVSFLSRILKPIGFGTYHTSLEVKDYCYTFCAGSGILKSKASNRELHVPTNGTFQESITLGFLSDDMDRSRISECINRLRRSYFTDSNYHLACRNCNSFTETFATTLLLADGQLADGSSLRTYPSWVNRLAKSGSNFIEHNDVCDVMKEARAASGVEGKVGWNLSSSSTAKRDDSAKEKRSKKKELTEAQKKALAKLRKK